MISLILTWFLLGYLWKYFFKMRFIQNPEYEKIVGFMKSEKKSFQFAVFVAQHWWALWNAAVFLTRGEKVILKMTKIRFPDFIGGFRMRNFCIFEILGEIIWVIFLNNFSKKKEKCEIIASWSGARIILQNNWNV